MIECLLIPIVTLWQFGCAPLVQPPPPQTAIYYSVPVPRARPIQPFRDAAECNWFDGSAWTMCAEGGEAAGAAEHGSEFSAD
jgi:hypothetical protein